MGEGDRCLRDADEDDEASGFGFLLTGYCVACRESDGRSEGCLEPDCGCEFGKGPVYLGGLGVLAKSSSR